MPSQRPTIDAVAQSWMRPVIVILSAMCVVVAGTIVVLLLDGAAGEGVLAAHVEPVEVATPAEERMATAAALDEARASVSVEEVEVELPPAAVEPARRSTSPPARRAPVRETRRSGAVHRPAPEHVESPALEQESGVEDEPVETRATARVRVLERGADTARVRFRVQADEQPILHWRKPGAGWKQAEMKPSTDGWTLHVRFTELEPGALLWWVGDAYGDPMTARGPGRPYGLALD